MTSTVARGTILSDPAELDSDGSSCEDRDGRKRLHGDLDSAGPKKRRKQTTPVRFPASLMAEDGEETEDDEDDEREGKPTRSPQTSMRIDPTTKDENLNNEFRCQYCSQFFNSKETMNLHVDSEHGAARSMVPNVQSRSSLQAQVQVKLETYHRQEERIEESPINLSGLSIKSFAVSWLSGQVQSQTQTLIQSQNEEYPSVNSVSTMPNHLQGLQPFPGALAQYLPLPGFSLADSGQIPRPPAVGPAPVRIFNPDAYCDLCNKEFCNKYFLKTHKANKHGIYVDSPGQSLADGTASYATTFTTAGNVKQEQSQRIDVTAVPPPLPVLLATPSVCCDVCQKRFKSEDSVRKHKQKVHGESADLLSESLLMSSSTNEDDREISGQSLSPGAMETLFKQEFGIEQEDTTFMPAPRHLSPQSIQQARDSGFSADRLRRLGVINPDAFCEICCKEYCNKYFLRTHKMKRHGIYIQDSEKSPSNPGAAASWHQIQTSPLNLIVTETMGNSSESSDRPGEDYECKSCGLRFQTFGLCQAHRRKMHESDEQRSPKQDYSEPESLDQRPDSISEDLQKLQTMILQLNGLESSRGAPCAICAKEFDTTLSLRAHMTTEHGAVIEDLSLGALQATEKSATPTGSGPAVNCTLCEKECSGHVALRKHITEEHQPSTPTSTSLTHVPPIVTIASTPATASAGQPERKASVSMTPTSSYCEICNKELCNKYFMKTHMQRMHGIEIENGAQIGGVICNICNKELCSKYFLRVHKHNTHGIVEEGGGGGGGGSSASTKPEMYETSGSDDSALKPDQLGDLSHRYFTHFTEVCPVCSRRFRSTKWLKAHLLGDHGKVGVDKWRELEQQYQTAARSNSRPVIGGGPARSAAHQTASLKIPNGLELAQQVKAADYSGLGNQVLSNLLGSSAEDQPLKSYRCLYCSFTTTVLPFLFLHERSHVSPQENASVDVAADRALQCPVCSQGFPQAELLHHHLLAQHQFPGLLSHFQPPTIGRPDLAVETHGDAKDKTDLESRDDRRQVSPQASSSIVTANDDSNKIQRPEDMAVQVTAQGAYKCAQCGYATANLNRIKKHIRKDHRSFGDPIESVIAELGKTLKDVANKQKVPASYAMPQDMNSNPDKTVMQPFLIEECEMARSGEERHFDKRFVPALVYLPVKARVTGVLTTSFTLTPA